MEHILFLADLFDQPHSQERHERLDFDCAMIGDRMMVRYYLGSLIGRNLFREPDAEVLRHLVAYVSTVASAQGASLLMEEEWVGWLVGAFLLRGLFETRVLDKAPRDRKQVAAVRALLTDPSISLPALATAAGTTEKQLARMTHVSLIRAVPTRRGKRRPA
ncbi:MAG TPA: hypothetical protein VH475_03475 [Tepidisphaeraceae bacterium]